MREKVFETEKGNIHYWINEFKENKLTLIFLPGLTADHRLFEKQIEFFENKYNVLVWDAPGHNISRPFKLTFSIFDKADYLHGIILKEEIKYPIIIGQSMGGYVGQCYIQNYPNALKGFISIDSAPLKRKYVTSLEIWLLKKTDFVFRPYPWKALKRAGTNGTTETVYGKKLMYEMMGTYSKKEYCDITCQGYRILAEAMEADLPYEIDCPVLLMCGEHDKAGSTKKYNQNWTKIDKLPIVWIPNAGHNSNTDNPEMVNNTIQEFLDEKIKI